MTEKKKQSQEQAKIESQEAKAAENPADNDANKVPKAKNQSPEQNDAGTNASVQSDGDAAGGDTTGTTGTTGGEGTRADNGGNSGKKGGRGGTAFSSDNKNEDESAENIVEEQSGTDEGASGRRGGNND
jgi:hypothetical protein